MTTKTCNRCKEEKDRSSYTIDNNKKDGLRTICKECTKKANSTVEARAANAKAMRDLRKTEKWKAYYKQCAKNWRKTEKGKEYTAFYSKYMNEKYPKRRMARRLLNEAIRFGRLEKYPCFTCGALEVEAHHPDYDRPLDVIWLCNKHHNEVHGK